MTMKQSNLENIKKLREITGAPLKDCKQALEENNQDLEAARMQIKKQGLLVGVIRGAKDTNQGIVTATTTKETPNNTPTEFGTITCLSCESDFVAKLDEFISTATEIALYTAEHEDITLETLQKEFKTKLSDLMSKMKENITISHYSRMDGEHIFTYNHQTNKLSVLVKFNKDCDVKIGKNIAMQIAGMNPLFIDYDDIPQSVLEAEKKICFEKTKEEDEQMFEDNPDYVMKSDEVIEKISKGRLDKSMDTMTLLNQRYTQAENKETVRQYLESIDKELKILAFRSFKIG